MKTEEVIEDVTDASGRYSLYVPAGTWIIREIEQEGWDQLSTADGDGTYTVTVPTVVDMEVSVSFPLNLFFSVAHAADIPTYVGPKNFGNNFVGTPNNGNSGGNGRKIELTNDNNDREGEVEGDSTSNEPDGEVLGAATSTLPVGAPATGAGGTSPVSISLPTLTAIMTSRTAYSRTKNG